MGPVHYCVVGFVEPDFHGVLARELAELVDRGLVRILDLVLVNKDQDGDVEAVEIDAVDTSAYSFLDGEYGGLVSDTDLELVGADLEPGTASAVIIWEDRCEEALAGSLRAAGGTLLAEGIIPPDVVEPALASLTPAT